VQKSLALHPVDRNSAVTDLLSHDDHAAILACIHDLHACRSLADFPQRSLAALARLVPSNLSAFNEVNMRRGRIVAITDREPPDVERAVAAWERHREQHPLIAYVQETGDGQAVKVSDLQSEDEYHALDLYRECYRLISAEDQMSVTLRSDAGVLIAIAFNRARRDFTEIDRLKLNVVRPHLLQAYANLEELEGRREEAEDLQTALVETGHGLIALDRAGRIAHATPGARETLDRFFPDAAAVHELPAPIAAWLAADPAVPFSIAEAGRALVVRRPRQARRPLLLLSERPARPLPGRLTPRETEVLHWIAEGKSNTEICAILGLALGTVKQHVEHILAKLGVENRTAAATIAREHGL
jgi:DNA-binding CsgD family transcriptional regulator